MNKYVITCCSTADLNENLLSSRDIKYASFTFDVDGAIYKDDYGKSYPIDKFYEDIKNGMSPLTSQVNHEAYIEMFEPLLKEGLDVLHITLSSGISGTINSATNAANELNDKYENKIHVVDSLCCSSGYGMLVMMAKDNQDKGMSLEENIKWLEDNRLKLIHWFYSSDLSSYVRGGRISKAAGLVGAALQICPVMAVSKEGKLQIIDKVRTKKKATRIIIDKMLEEVGEDYSGYCYISNSACLEDAESMKEMLLETFKNLKEVNIFNVGTVIGAHTGPGTIAMYYMGKERV